MAVSDPNGLKKRLKELNKEKRFVSKAVGDAKKTGQDAHELIQKVKQISNQIKALESEIKLSRQQSESGRESSAQELPPQFSNQPQQNDPDSELQLIINPPDNQWDSFVDQHLNATIYHTSAIRRVIEKTFNHRCHYLAATDGQGVIHGVLPMVEQKSQLFGHFMTSMPFFNYGGLLSSSSTARACLLRSAETLAKTQNVSHIEYRHCNNQLDLPSKSEKVAMIRQLPDTPEQLWSDIGTKVRAQIKKSQKTGTDVRIGREEMVADFYKVFSRNMRDLGTPVYPISLFYNMLEFCPEATIAIVYLGNKPISAGFLLGWRNTLEIPWASTIREANRFNANMLLYWEVLQYAITRGYRVFDFGRSSADSSTFRFKKQWGANSHRLYWNYWLPEGAELPAVNPNNPKYRMMIGIWKKLPLVVSNNLGPYIVRNIP